ncbi:MAG: type II toxin-antitoxin system RelE/ParE family toxin [Variibacter sp.]|nr:type II toxin-antitoxin system RelE/ParE family toxin [Variibacter sp.]
MRVRYTSQARNDLAAILEYLAERSPGGARNLRRAFDRTLRLIGEHPASGRLVEEEGTRVLPALPYPYLIYWNVEGGEAWILHIRHAARHPWTG